MAEKPYGEKPLSDYNRSLELQERALQEIPEAASSNHRGKTSYEPYPLIYMDSADGAMVRDVDGNEYIDFHCGVSALITGHRPEHQIEEVKDQLNKGPYFATTFEREYEAANLFNELIPASDLTKFISTGTEAAMSAMKLARAYTGKEKILKFEGMYHGHTDYALVNVHPHPSALGTRRNPMKIPDSTGIPKETMESVEAIPWNDSKLLEQKLKKDGDEIAAVITEGVMSNSGLIWPTDEFIKDVRELTEEHDVLFIMDEVVTGFRMGLTGAQGYFDVEPDLSIFGKGIANGYPSAALTGKEEVMQFIKSKPDRATFMGTFSGNPMAIAATKANLEILQEIGHSGYEELYKKGEKLCDGFREIAADVGEDVFVSKFAGFTALHFIESDSDPESWQEWRDIALQTDDEKYREFAAAMVGEGIFIPPNNSRINLMHAHTDEHIDQALESAKVAIELLSN